MISYLVLEFPSQPLLMLGKTLCPLFLRYVKSYNVSKITRLLSLPHTRPSYYEFSQVILLTLKVSLCLHFTVRNKLRSPSKGSTHTSHIFHAVPCSPPTTAQMTQTQVYGLHPNFPSILYYQLMLQRSLCSARVKVRALPSCPDLWAFMIP